MIEDYSEVVESDLEALFTAELVSANTGDIQDWSVSRYYGSPTIESMVMDLYNKVQAGVPSVFVSVDNQNFEGIDTLGEMFNTDLSIRVMVAANIVKDRQLKQANRFVNSMIFNVLKALAGQTVAIGGLDRSYEVVQVANLFRVRNMDAKQVTLQIEGINVDLSA